MTTRETQSSANISPATPSFSSFIGKAILNLRVNKQFRTARNYRSAQKSLHDFLCKNEILFFELTSQRINAYETWLEKKGVSRNTISFYMRILRSLYNKAIEQQFTGQ